MLATIAGYFAMGTAQQASAQIAVGVEPETQCPYGYYDAVLYDCAPYGYYGPDLFVGGVFIGSGRWFHGPANFYGYVDNRYDPHHGYVGPLPSRGERPFYYFHGNEGRDGRGHMGNAGHDGAREHALPGYRGGQLGGHR